MFNDFKCMLSIELVTVVKSFMAQVHVHKTSIFPCTMEQCIYLSSK